MPRRKRRALHFNIETDVIYSVLSLLLLLLSAISFVSYFAPFASINSIIQEIMRELFGNMAFFIPFFLLYFGLLFVKTFRLKILQIRILTGFLLAFLSLSGLMSSYAGLVGVKINFIVDNAFGEVASSIFFVICLIISILVIFNLSLDKIFKYFSRLIDPLKNIVDLKSLKSDNKKGHDKKNTASGDLFEDTDVVESAEKIEIKEKRQEVFEVIPNIAEPLSSKSPNKSKNEFTGKTSTISTIGGIPAVDRVWEYPSLSLLSDAPKVPADRGNTRERSQIIERTLDSFGIHARVKEVNPGPAVTQYALETAKGTKIAKITTLSNDLALALASPNGTVRIEAPIPGKTLIGIEVPNFSPELVTLRSVLAFDSMKTAKSKLAVALGLDVSGKPIISDICRMPHVLIAGSTGSGKSVLLNTIICTVLFRCSPEECKLVLIDPKRVEFAMYRDIPHLLTPVIVDTDKAVPALRWAVMEMDKRYKMFENAKVRNIDAFNEMSGFQALPYIIIIVDELAELMHTSRIDVEKYICRLAQKSRATGIHLILATQRPSVDVLTGLIKANIPCRIAFNVTSQIDSRVIIDMVGAEKLLGRGDMLYVPPDASKPTRIQGVFVSESETMQLVDFIRSSSPEPEYKDEVTKPIDKKNEDGIAGFSDDPNLQEAVELICRHKKASTSFLQRKLGIGYGKAARLMDLMEEKGIIGPQESGSKPRAVLIEDPSDVVEEEQ